MNIFLAVLLFLSPLAYARQAHLPSQAIERIRQYKAMLEDVEPRPVQAIAAELENTDHPMLNLQIKEAMARTFADIVKQEQIEGIKKRQWLYSKVALNMAYLQFGGSAASQSLDRLILRELKKNLPAEVLEQRGFNYSLE